MSRQTATRQGIEETVCVKSGLQDDKGRKMRAAEEYEDVKSRGEIN